MYKAEIGLGGQILSNSGSSAQVGNISVHQTKIGQIVDELQELINEIASHERSIAASVRRLVVMDSSEKEVAGQSPILPGAPIEVRLRYLADQLGTLCRDVRSDAAVLSEAV